MNNVFLSFHLNFVCKNIVCELGLSEVFDYEGPFVISLVIILNNSFEQ